MRILIIGSKGNMGRRYVAICKYLGHEVVECDLHNDAAIMDNPPKVDRCIIATPLYWHTNWCSWCVLNKIPFLCEKPISKIIENIKALNKICDDNRVDGRMVCNWMFLACPERLIIGKENIYFDYYNTGKDGFWDLIQPVYIAKEFIFNNESPIYKCSINENHYSQLHFDKSYLIMIHDWIAESKYIWSLGDAIKAHEKLMEWKDKNWHE